MMSSSPNIELVNHIHKNIADKEVSENQYMVIAPSGHCGFWGDSENTVIGERNVGNAYPDYDGMINNWFDYWLKGDDNGFVKKLPYVQYYTMGMNKWQTAEESPPSKCRDDNFLHAQHRKCQQP